MANAQDRLQELLDYHDIRNLLAEYCHGCDRFDVQEMAGTYLEDSWDDHGRHKMPGREFARAVMAEGASWTSMLNHNLGQSSIRLNGDEAGAETYFIANLAVPGADGRQTMNQIGGRYVDTLWRTAEGWKIKHRVCVKDWCISMPIEDWGAKDGWVVGQRSQDDPSYAVLRRTHSGAPAGA